MLLKNPGYRHEVFHLKEAGYDPKTQGYTGIAELEGKTLPIVDRVEANWVKQVSARWNSFSKGNEIVNTTLQNEQLETVLASRHPVKLKPEYAEKDNFRVATESGMVFNMFNFDNEYFARSSDPKINAQNKALRCAIIKSFNW